MSIGPQGDRPDAGGSTALLRIVASSPEWPTAFEAEAAGLRAALGTRALRIDHVGSTAVAGLAAKPVIDVQVSVPALQPRQPLVDALASLGYAHVDLGDFDRVYPFFQRPGPATGRAGPGTHHVHLCVTGSPQEHDHLAFRDALRADAVLARSYEELKRHLAALHHGRTLDSREAYSLAKTDFVQGVLTRCRRPVRSEAGGADAPPAWRFRAATAAEGEVLAAVRVEAMRPSVQRIGRFDAARARDRFLSRFEPRWTRWIEWTDERWGGRPGEPAGLVVLRPDEAVPTATRQAASSGSDRAVWEPDRVPDRWLLDHFYLRPAWQGGGLGSAVLQALLAETDRSGRAVRVGALRDSPANAFYRRHGFQGLEETEWDLYHLRPAAPWPTGAEGSERDASGSSGPSGPSGHPVRP